MDEKRFPRIPCRWNHAVRHRCGEMASQASRGGRSRVRDGDRADDGALNSALTAIGFQRNKGSPERLRCG